MVGKGENAGYQHFFLVTSISPSLTIFAKGFLFRVLKNRDYVVNR